MTRLEGLVQDVDLQDLLSRLVHMWTSVNRMVLAQITDPQLCCAVN